MKNANVLAEQAKALRNIIEHCNGFHRNSAIALGEVQHMAQEALTALEAMPAEQAVQVRFDPYGNN